MIAGDGVESSCVLRIGGHCSGSHLSAPQACAHWAFLPNDTSSQLYLPVAMENSSVMEPVGTVRTILGSNFLWPTVKAEGTPRQWAAPLTSSGYPAWQ